jgi:hypothetical protein
MRAAEVENGKIYYPFILNGDMKLPGLEFMVMFYYDGENFRADPLNYVYVRRHDALELFSDVHYCRETDEEISYEEWIAQIDGLFAATFTANYEPSPFTVFELNEEIVVNGKSVTLKRMEISDVSIRFTGIGLDVEIYYVVDGVKISGEVLGGEAMFQGSGGHAYSMNDGVEGESSFYGNFHDGFDKTTLEAIIINGVEFPLEW